MNRIILTLAAIAVLAGCTSPRIATLEDGKITNITSAEAVTLAKAKIRSDKVDAVQKATKPIFKLVAQPGQTIQISGVESLEVNVPLDLDVLMAEQPDAVSENVQLFREVRGIARETIVPLGLAAAVLENQKSARQSAAEQAAIQGETDRAQIAADAAFRESALDAAEKPPVILTVPLGSAVLGTETTSTEATAVDSVE